MTDRDGHTGCLHIIAELVKPSVLLPCIRLICLVCPCEVGKHTGDPESRKLCDLLYDLHGSLIREKSDTAHSRIHRDMDLRGLSLCHSGI